MILLNGNKRNLRHFKTNEDESIWKIALKVYVPASYALKFQFISSFGLISVNFLSSFLLFRNDFLDAIPHLYKRVCPSVGRSEGHAFVETWLFGIFLF